MALQGTKGALSSLTINAGIVGTLASIASAFGVHIAPEVLPQAEAIVTGIAALLSIYGRFRAKTLIA